jgi:hypothetical protein
LESDRVGFGLSEIGHHTIVDGIGTALLFDKNRRRRSLRNPIRAFLNRKLRQVIPLLPPMALVRASSNIRSKPQWPSSMALVRAQEIPARIRIIADFSMPSFMAPKTAWRELSHGKATDSGAE